MKTIFSFCVIFFSSILVSTGQESKIKFGKISPSDLSMKIYPSDTDAIAVVLSKIGRIQYDPLVDKYALSEQRHIVIKILKEAGIDEYGNVVIKYYDHNEYSRLANIKAIVHLPDGTDIKVDNSQIFDEKINDFWSSKKIAFPKLIPGAIIEYQYTKVTSGMFQPVDWFFQSHIPMKYVELTTKIPDWFDYIVLTQGGSLDKVESETKREGVSFNNITRTGYRVVSSEVTHETIDVDFITNTYINQDVPALKEECCITTMEDYYSRVRFQLRAIQYPNQSREQILSSWSKLAEELYKLPDWGGQFRNKRPGESVLEAAGINSTASTNQMETAQKIYDYINNNIKWNDNYDYSTGNDINAILKAKSGNSGDLNKLMCAALLRSDIKAHPVLISTRNNGKSLELYPFLDQFDHMVVLAKIDDKDTWIDLGDKNLPLGMLRPDALNSRGWVVDEVESFWTDIKPIESKSIFLIKGSLDKEGNLNGDLESRFTGYHALDQRNSAEDEKEKYGEKLIICGTNPLKIDETELINAKNTSKPFQMKAKIINQSIATATSDKLYINPIFPQGLDENPFKYENRTYPIEMNYPEEFSLILNVSLPEGYIIESVPEPIRFVTENGGIQVTYESSSMPGKLNVTLKYSIKQLQYEPAEYSTLKNFYTQRHQKFNEQIVLTKV